jgi:type II secretory pathway predicted ATPase ExeA
MYRNFFGLKENPFRVNPDPRFLFLTGEVREALACLTYGVQSRKGFMLLTGEVGTGKTTILNKLLEGLREARVATAFIFNPRLSANQFLYFMLGDFGISCESRMKSQVLLQLNQWLLERYRSRETAVLIVDEAQDLSPEVLEEIRLLTNLETATEKLLQIVLSGQPELENLINQPALRQLRQRFTLRCRLMPLTLEETRGYISERLRIAGASGEPVFDPGAVEVVFRHSGGIPRLINLLCEHSLITAYAEEQKPVLASTVQSVAEEFELDKQQVISFPPGELGRPPSQLEESLQNLGQFMDRMRKGD